MPTLYILYRKGEDFTEMGKSVTVTYSSGEWSGYLVRDKIGFFGNFSMAIGPFALITSSTEFFIEGAEWVGILGLAYRSLAKVYIYGCWCIYHAYMPEICRDTPTILGSNSTLYNMQPQSSVGTVWDSLREENFLRDVFALQLCPPKESTIFPGTFVEQGGSMVSQSFLSHVAGICNNRVQVSVIHNTCNSIVHNRRWVESIIHFTRLESQFTTPR